MVDGTLLNITHFHKGILPSPLSHEVVNLPSIPKKIFVAEDKIFVVLNALYSFPSGEIIFNSPVDNVFVMNSEKFASDQQNLYKITNKTEELIRSFESPIGKLFGTKENLFVELSDGSILTEKTKITKLLAYCEEVAVMNINGKYEIIGLANNVLYFSDKILATGVTSFLVSKGFLFFTKKNAPFDLLFVFDSNNLP